jgi:hypothetical protein
MLGVSLLVPRPAVVMIAHLILPGMQATTAISDTNIDTAVTAWPGITSPTTATTAYGDMIVGWNTAAVTTMASLFESKPTFSD